MKPSKSGDGKRRFSIRVEHRIDKATIVEAILIHETHQVNFMLPKSARAASHWVYEMFRSYGLEYTTCGKMEDLWTERKKVESERRMTIAKEWVDKTFPDVD